MKSREYSFSTFLTSYLISLLALLITVLLLWIYLSTNRSLKEQQDLTIHLNNKNASLVIDDLQQELLSTLSESAATLATLPSHANTVPDESLNQFLSQESLANLDFLRFIPVGPFPVQNADSPFFDFSGIKLTESMVSMQMVDQCQIIIAENPVETLFLVVTSHRIIQVKSGKVLGHLVGGIVLNNNLPLTRKILLRSNAELTALQIGEQILTASTPLSPLMHELLRQNTTPITRTTAVLQTEKERLIISGHVYSLGERELTIRMVYKDSLLKEMQITFIRSGLLLLTATAIIFFTLYTLSKRQANRAMHNLVKYTNAVVSTPDTAEFIPDRLIEFNSIGRAIEKMVAKLNQANKQLIDTKNRLEMVIAGADLGSWDWDIEHDTVIFNERWGGMLGYRDGELKPVSETWEKLIHPEDIERVTRTLNLHLEGISSFYITEHRLKHKSGHWVWVLTAGKVLLRDDNGAPLRAAGIHLDITKQKTAEDALTRERALLISMINSIPDLIFYKDQDGAYLGCNKAFENFVGRPVTEIIGNSDADIFSPETAEISQIQDRELMNSGLPQRNEEWVTFPDGHNELLDIVKTPLLGPDNTIIGVIAISRDITTLKETEKKLADERERLAVTLRSIGDGVITTDTDGAVVMLNKAAEQLCGWTSKEAEGLPSGEVFRIINGKTRLTEENPAEKVMKSGQTVSLNPDTILIAKDGTQRKIADSGAPIHDRQSKIIGSVIVFRDVTDQQRMEDEILKVRKLESIGVLAGGIAHDFNNILSAILGNLELTAALLPEENTKIHSLVKNARKATTRAAKLTNQLLTFSKGGEPVLETTSLPKLIQDSADFVLHGSPVSCDYDFPEDLWLADVDTGQLSQVIQNITINAKHAMPSGGTIVVCASNIHRSSTDPILSSDDRNFIKVSITDTGHGIPEEIVDRIFDPYFTTKQEGSGLGLAISHSIIQKHGGYLTVQSHPGEGTTFTLYIPKAHKTNQESTTESNNRTTSRSLKVMIMDDEEMIRTVAQEQLKALGHIPILAENGEQALELYQHHHDSGTPVDVVIMDLTIRGGMGGLEASRELLERDPKARIIVASGYSTDPVMSRYEDYGVQAAIVKPFDMTILQKALQIAIHD